MLFNGKIIAQWLRDCKGGRGFVDKGNDFIRRFVNKHEVCFREFHTGAGLAIAGFSRIEAMYVGGVDKEFLATRGTCEGDEGGVRGRGYGNGWG